MALSAFLTDESSSSKISLEASVELVGIALDGRADSSSRLASSAAVPTC